tara:strand:- start:7395 stop:7718 length:324 start_codon:yes stop_codon:yes gene_type:complete
MTRKTKIVATIGPSVYSKDSLNKLVEAGANVLRLNFSHGTYDEHEQTVQWVRSMNKNVAIMQDIQGPKIRTGTLDKSINLNVNSDIDIFNEKVTKMKSQLLSIMRIY